MGDGRSPVLPWAAVAAGLLMPGSYPVPKRSQDAYCVYNALERSPNALNTLIKAQLKRPQYPKALVYQNNLNTLTTVVSNATGTLSGSRRWLRERASPSGSEGSLRDVAGPLRAGRHVVRTEDTDP